MPKFTTGPLVLECGLRRHEINKLHWQAYCDIKLDYDYGDDEICRAQDKVGSA